MLIYGSLKPPCGDISCMGKLRIFGETNKSRKLNRNAFKMLPELINGRQKNNALGCHGVQKLYYILALGVCKQQQSLLLYAVVHSDSSLVNGQQLIDSSLVNGQQLISIKAPDTRNITL